MKKHLLIIATAVLWSAILTAQNYIPVSVSGFNVDAIAENQPCSSYTSQAIDGSDNDMYDIYYGTLYGTGVGLPNNGSIANGVHVYQLQPFTQNNVLYITHGNTDSLTIDTPQAFSSISLLAFNTEGTGNVDITFEYTDGSSYAFPVVSLHDWFSGFSPVISGFDRVSRASGTPNYNTVNPMMYAVDLVLPCADQLKLLKTIVVFNNSTNPRTCVAAVSGRGAASFSLTNTNPTCQGGNNGKALLNVSGGNGPFTYSWSTSPVQTADSATGLAAGYYSVSATDAASCTFIWQDTLLPGAPLTLTLSATPDSVCAGSSTTLNAHGAVSYVWSAGTSTDSVNTVTPVATTTYSVTATTSIGCVEVGNVNVVMKPMPTVGFTAVPSDSVCAGSSLTLSGTGASTYTWTGGVTNGVSFSPTATTTYIVTGNVTGGCANTTTVTVTVNPLPEVGLIAFPSDTLCAGSDLQLSGIRALSYSWSGGVINGAPFGATTTTTYTVTGTDGNSCVNTASVLITVKPVPTITATITPADSVCYGSMVTLSASGGAQYAWSGGETNNVPFTQLLVNTYTVTGTAANGCYNTASVAVVVTVCQGTAGIDELNPFFTNIYPNPNNGSFSISFGRAMETMNVQVTDMEGREVYRANEINIQAGDVRQISLNNPADGLYILRLTSGTESYTDKITVDK